MYRPEFKWEKITFGFGLTQCGSTYGHDAIVRERPRLKLHVLVSSFHFHSTLTESNTKTSQRWAWRQTARVSYRQDSLSTLDPSAPSDNDNKSPHLRNFHRKHERWNMTLKRLQRAVQVKNTPTVLCRVSASLPGSGMFTLAFIRR